MLFIFEIILYCVNFTIAIKIKMIDFNSVDTVVGGGTYSPGEDT